MWPRGIGKALSKVEKQKDVPIHLMECKRLLVVCEYRGCAACARVLRLVTPTIPRIAARDFIRCKMEPESVAVSGGVNTEGNQAARLPAAPFRRTIEMTRPGGF